MKQTISTITIGIGLALGAGHPAAQACECKQMLPQLGSGTSEVSTAHNNTSIAAMGDRCYVMYAGGGAPDGALHRWRLFVKKTTPEGAWVLTNGGNPLNFDPNKSTQPYFYDRSATT